MCVCVCVCIYQFSLVSHYDALGSCEPQKLDIESIANLRDEADAREEAGQPLNGHDVSSIHHVLMVVSRFLCESTENNHRFGEYNASL